MSTDQLLRCYNKGCGKEYKEEENGEGNNTLEVGHLGSFCPIDSFTIPLIRHLYMKSSSE